jgi:hypothetical protein
VPRSYHVKVTTVAMRELRRMITTRQTEILTELKRMSDDDIHSFERLPWPPGRRGTWIFTPGRGRWRYVAEWDPGMPNLWALGYGKGTLTVSGIRHRDHAHELLKGPPPE